jgi:hypothetical protein
LHAYWDVGVVDALGRSADDIADTLDARLTVPEMKKWVAGSTRDWAMESFEIAQHHVYALPSLPTCAAGGAIALSSGYRDEAEKDAAAQLLKAAIRMASLLNGALGRWL